MPTRWRRGGRHRDDLALWGGAAVLPVYVGGLWDHDAVGAEDDDSVRDVLLRAVRRWDDCGELADVADQTLKGRTETGNSVGIWRVPCQRCSSFDARQQPCC